MLSRRRRISPVEAHLKLRRELEIAFQNWYLNHDPEAECILWHIYWERYNQYRAFFGSLRGRSEATA